MIRLNDKRRANAKRPGNNTYEYGSCGASKAKDVTEVLRGSRGKVGKAV